jgi:hypothetical protein
MAITGIYTKDFPDLGRDAGEADLIPIAEVGNIVTKKTPVSGLITSARVVGALGFTPYNATNPAGYISGITSGMVTTALGFTPYNATNPAGYISGITSGMVTTALGFTPYNATNPAGYISGITSGMVTTALGFTPYNASNPAGYTSNLGTVTSVSGTGTVSGLTLSGTVTSSGSLTLGGTLTLTSGQVTTALGFTPYNSTNPAGYITSAALSGYLPLTGGTLASSGSTNTLNINHSSGSGIALNILKNGNGEALTIVKGSGSGNAASITGGITLLSELNLTTKLADAHINSASTWNAKIGGSGTTNFLPKFTGASALGNSLIFDNGTNVGIGTTSPSEILHLRSSQPVIRFEKTGILNWRAGNITGNDYAITVDNITGTAFTILSGSGNVGIGTTSPEQLLTLNQSLNNTTIGLYNSNVTANNRNWTIGSNDQTYGDFSIVQSNANGGNPTSAGTRRFYINPSGNVGIGTTSPNTRLHVVGGNGEVARLESSPFDAVSGNGPALAFQLTQSNGQSAQLGLIKGNVDTNWGGFLTFNTKENNGTPNNTTVERMRITSGGNVLIGTTTDAGYKLDVNGTGRFGGALTGTSATFSVDDLNTVFVSNPTTSGGTTGSGIGFKAYNGTSVTQSAGIILTSNTWSFGTYLANQLSIGSDGTGGVAIRSSNSAPIRFYTGGTTAGLSTQRLEIASTGAATFSNSVTASSFFVSSDITLKTLTQDKFDASKIDAISYKWKTDLQGKTLVGYSAQDVQKYMPDAVNTDSNGKLSVDYIQVLVQKIAHLENKLKEHGLE